MSAINFVVRDGAGNIQHGVVAGEGAASSIIVGSGADVSLNLTRGQIVAYTRQGQALQVTLLDGRVIVIEGFFTADGVAENQLFISADGYLTEVQLTAGAGDDYYATFVEQGASEKFAMNDDLYFMRSADVMLAESYVPADDDVGMLAGFAAPLFGWGGAAAAAGAAAIIGTGGGGGGGPAAPSVAIVGGTGSDDIVNEEDYADGVEISGTATPGALLTVTVEGVEKTLTVAEDGTWEVVYAPGEIPDGTYETEVLVSVTNEGGTTTTTGTLYVDTEVSVTFDEDIVETDGTINAAENADGTTLTGSVEAGSTVVVTIEGVDHEAVVTGDTWSLDLPAGVIAGGEYDLDVTVTATDAVDNTTSTSGTVHVDTITDVTVSTTGVGGSDGVVNAQEHPGGVTLTGTAEAGATVEVTLGAVTHTVTAGTDGSWSSTWNSSEVPTGEHTLPVTVTSTDAAGNTATASASVEVDTEMSVTLSTAGVGGSDGIVNASEHGGGVTLTGASQPGATVVVTLGTVVKTVTAGSDGSWSASWTSGEVPTGETDVPVTVTATDAAGNSASTSGSIEVDTEMGVTLSTAGVGGADGIVNETEHGGGVTLRGTSDPGATVVVTLGTVSKTVTADSNGNWTASWTSTQVPTGETDVPVTVSATDAAGNTASTSGSITVDTDMDVTLDTSAVGGADNVVNDAEHDGGITVVGTTEAFATVAVTMAGITKTVTADGNGDWSATWSAGQVPTGEDTLPVSVTATDAAGNTASATGSVQIDTEIGLTFDDSGVGGADNTINMEEAAEGVTLVGTTDPNSTVVVSLNGTTYSTTADAAGNWSVTYAAADLAGIEDDAQIVIESTDPYGNSTTLTDSVSIDIDTVAPDAPVVESVTITEDGVEYVGTETTTDEITISEVDAGHNVTELMGSGDGVTLPWGETLFHFDPALSDGSHLVVTETDDAGNENSTFLVLEETGTDVVDLEGLDGFNIGAIDLSFAKDAELTIDAATLQDLSSIDNNLIIHGGTDDAVTLNGASAAGTTSIDGKDYDIYTMGDDGVIFIEDGVDTTVI